jgi:hypothetical protein
MKNLKLLFTCILIATQSMVKSQNIEKFKEIEKIPKNCCPDGSGLISSSDPTNPEIMSADISIDNAQITKNPNSGKYTFKASVFSSQDDCSACVKIIVMLPSEVTVESFNAITADNVVLNMVKCKGGLVLEVDSMCPQANYPAYPNTIYIHEIKITVVTSKHSAKVSNASFSIFATSKIPDLVKENNYWSGKMD